ncbi:MAG: hypothetical protein R3F37_00915 [Candidatus Competibacteraceae bacterium]
MTPKVPPVSNLGEVFVFLGEGAVDLGQLITEMLDKITVDLVRIAQIGMFHSPPNTQPTT